MPDRQGPARPAEFPHYYDLARQFARLVATDSAPRLEERLYICTGGGPGIMEAANRGAHDVGAPSVGLNIALPHEQSANPYVTPHLSFKFHYFALRKMHFMMRAKALVAFPGGFGTLDELFEVITLVQTKKAKPVPIVLFGSDYWKRLINFDVLVEEGAISPRTWPCLPTWTTRRRPGTSSATFTSSEADALLISAGARADAAATPCAYPARPAARPPRTPRYPDHRTGRAEQQRHHHAGGIDGHQAQAQRLALAMRRRDLVQGAHDHGLHRAQGSPSSTEQKPMARAEVHERVHGKQHGVAPWRC
jgi:uncharacterized protein (TIGR00730 family)